MIVAEIDRDYTNSTEPGDTVPSRVGQTWAIGDEYAAELFGDDSPSRTSKVRFRCKDDDGEVYYGGWLLNDSEGEVQLTVPNWCMFDAGCTIIEIKVPADKVYPLTHKVDTRDRVINEWRSTNHSVGVCICRRKTA